MRKKIERIRNVVQLFSIIIFTGLFGLILYNFRKVYESILDGVSKFNVQALYIILPLIGITLIFGRFFCGWLCAFGAINDFIYKISKKAFKIKFKVNKKVDSTLKAIKYIYLLGIVVLTWTLGNNFLSTYDPWNAYAKIKYLPSSFINKPSAFLILLSTLIGAAFVERFFCKYLCPLGAIQGMISKLKISNISKDTSLCGKCTLCTKKCPMGINLNGKESIMSSECISCLNCVSNCPKKNAKQKIIGLKTPPIIFIVLGLILFFMSYFSKASIIQSLTENKKVVSEEKSQDVSEEKILTHKNIYNFNHGNKVYNNFLDDYSILEEMNKINTNNKSNENSNDEESMEESNYSNKFDENIDKKVQEKKENIIYNNGTFKGKELDLSVEVTLYSDKIVSIEIKSHGEDIDYFEKPFEKIPKDIIEKQTTEVDVVSGATNTSERLLKAIDNALEKAKIKN
ncbi:4Fe-4S binding protein [Oceanirhabdus seepicola]|uniref:4Fe-4S binding protein n=1 Tax=Oceanirhabdus seepicola TaxID=2828781 RepID=A0A9J6PF25_9CLOT|nr:4Fe-4S binding protein [Oceanirhabdus seepicola]MCM1992832.1 4Fe-4S binding protein [Oceanirhabdus seepicola]